MFLYLCTPMRNERIEWDDAHAEIACFETGGNAKEYHVMIHAKDVAAPFQEQLETVICGYEKLKAKELNVATPVMKRYFLSDVANQGEEVLNADTTVCAKSIVGQPPLDGTKVALWVYLLTDATSSKLSNGLYEVKQGGIRHLWSASANCLNGDSEQQMLQLFNDYVDTLAEEGCTLADNCLRTWLFVNDIDNNYAGVVKARNTVFAEQGLTKNTHYIASTGIGGRAINHKVLAQMDAYAVAGIHQEQVHYLYAPTHLNRTSDYGVSFERGTYIDYPDHRQVFISGTASIDNHGQIVYPKDIVNQTHRMWENVEMLLAEADCNFDHVGVIIVYLRDMADYQVVKKLFGARYPDIPTVIVHAPVCRPGWLIEMECMAIKKI